VRTADTSVLVAAFASWHEKHDLAWAAIAGGVRLVEHCALETYSVLTRLPAPHRAPAPLVRDFLSQRFPEPFLRMTPRAYRRFLLGLADNQLTGGAVYDALIAATATAAGAELVTFDRRALPTYGRYATSTTFL
jgi:predicted nucleic acid-binding protein